MSHYHQTTHEKNAVGWESFQILDKIVGDADNINYPENALNVEKTLVNIISVEDERA